MRRLVRGLLLDNVDCARSVDVGVATRVVNGVRKRMGGLVRGCPCSVCALCTRCAPARVACCLAQQYSELLAPRCLLRKPFWPQFATRKIRRGQWLDFVGRTLTTELDPHSPLLSEDVIKVQHEGGTVSTSAATFSPAVVH